MRVFLNHGVTGAVRGSELRDPPQGCTVTHDDLSVLSFYWSSMCCEQPCAENFTHAVHFHFSPEGCLFLGEPLEGKRETWRLQEKHTSPFQSSVT